jgi:RNA polymerase sigma factor (sigma-70 family)
MDTTITSGTDASQRRPAMKRELRSEADFVARIEQHAGIVRKVAHAYSRTAADRRDLEQEIVAQLWKAWPGYDGARPFATWMYRVALNVAISIARSQRWQAPEAVPVNDGEIDALDDTAEREHGVCELMAFIGALDELNRALILLYLEGQSYAEIADVLGISETNVATKINRAKQTLRARMNPQGEHDGAR